MARIDPAHAKTYEANRLAFLARLSAKLTEWEARLAPLRSMPLIAYHNSWPYFARRFRLDFADFLEIKPGVPSTPSHLAGIIETMRTRGVRIVVREAHERGARPMVMSGLPSNCHVRTCLPVDESNRCRATYGDNSGAGWDWAIHRPPVYGCAPARKNTLRSVRCGVQQVSYHR